MTKPLRLVFHQKKPKKPGSNNLSTNHHTYNINHHTSKHHVKIMGESTMGRAIYQPPNGVVLHLVTNHRTSTFQIGNLLKIPGGAEMRISDTGAVAEMDENLITKFPRNKHPHDTPFWINVWSFCPSVVGFWVGFLFSLEKRICWEGEFQCERHETKNPPTKATNKQTNRGKKMWTPKKLRKMRPGGACVLQESQHPS